MKMKKYASFDDYLDDQPPKNRSIIRALRRFVKRVEPGLEESVKWGNGCWVKEKVPKESVPSSLRLLGAGSRPVWLFTRLRVKGPKGPSRRQWPVCKARQGPQALRHRRGLCSKRSCDKPRADRLHDGYDQLMSKQSVRKCWQRNLPRRLAITLAGLKEN